MSEIKLSNRYSLLISKKINKEEIIDFIEYKLNKVVASSMGLRDSYQLVIKDKNNNYVTSLDISTRAVHNIHITEITEEVEGKEINGKEVFTEDIKILHTFIEKYPGMIIGKYYRTEDYCELDKTGYSINYDENSIEYKLIEVLLDDIDDPGIILATAELLKNKKEQLSEIFIKKEV